MFIVEPILSFNLILSNGRSSFHMRRENPVCLVFRGDTTGKYDLNSSKKRFKQLFKLVDTQVERLFTGKEMVIKTNITEDIARKLAARIADAGCRCSIEPVPDEKNSTLRPGFIERRKKGRRTRFRRLARPDSIVPDRRLKCRRKTDVYVYDPRYQQVV